MNASTSISALMGSAGTQRAPSAVFVTRGTEHPPLGTTVKVRIAPDFRIRNQEMPESEGYLGVIQASVL